MNATRLADWAGCSFAPGQVKLKEFAGLNRRELRLVMEPGRRQERAFWGESAFLPQVWPWTAWVWICVSPFLGFFFALVEA